MRIYACDKCGAEFRLRDDEFDDVCPECCSDRTTLMSQDEGDGGFGGELDEGDDFEDELDGDDLDEY